MLQEYFKIPFNFLADASQNLWSNSRSQTKKLTVANLPLKLDDSLVG